MREGYGEPCDVTSLSLSLHSMSARGRETTTTENHYRLGRAAGLATPSGTAPAGAGAAAGPGTTGAGYHPGGVGLP